MNSMKSKFGKVVATLAIAGIASVSLAACGEDSSSEDAVQSVAAVDALAGKTTAVTLDQGFADALASLKLTPGVTGTAKLTDGALVFPVTGGNVKYFKPGTVDPYVIGQVQHEGSGFSLTAGETTVEINNLNVDPGISRVYGDVLVNGELAVASAYIFTLDGSTLKPLQTEGADAILEGTRVLISPVAAELLNSTFKTDAVTSDLLVGIAKITIATQ